MTKAIGRFYFKRTSNGNLVGEFSNSASKIIQTESAIKVKSTTSFIGDYTSSWDETDSNSPVTLRISFKPRTNNSIYTLTWIEKGVEIYWGEGMLCDDILIGDYRNFKNI